jgi:hypothetical protein
VTALAFGVDQIEELENENILFDDKLRVGFLIQQRARADAVDWGGCLINSFRSFLLRSRSDD